MRTVPLGDAETEGFQIDINFGPNIQAFPEVLDAVQFAVDTWEEQLQDPVSLVIDVDLAELANPGLAGLFPGSSNLAAPTLYNYAAQLFDTSPTFDLFGYGEAQTAMIDDAGDHEGLVKQLPTVDELNVTLPGNSVVPFAASTNMLLTTANAKALGLTPSNNVASAYDINDAAIDGTILISDNLQDLIRL